MKMNNGCESRECPCGSRVNCPLYRKRLIKAVETGGCDDVRKCASCYLRINCQVYMDIIHVTEWECELYRSEVLLWYKEVFREGLTAGESVGNG